MTAEAAPKYVHPAMAIRMTKLRDYLRIRDAAEFLGVSQATLRNWGRDGRIATHRNPVNGYRLYRKSDLESLLKKVERSRQD